MDYINLLAYLAEIIAIPISIWAIYTAKGTEKKQRELSAQQNKPDCRIKASSIENGSGIDIRLENVGTGVMIVDDITYHLTVDNKSQQYDKELQSYTNLSQFFYGIDCKTRSEASLKKNHLLPNSNHNLFKSTFRSQDDLLKAWERVKNIKIKVTYHGVCVGTQPGESHFEEDYAIFMAAISDGSGGIRKLDVFSK